MNFDRDAHPEISGEVGSFHQARGQFFVRIEGRFESAHYLYRYFPDGSDEPMHGHSWLVELFLARSDGGIGVDGISFDFLNVRRRLDQMIERIEHVCINDLREFKGVNPTSENIARWFFAGLRAAVAASSGRLLEIRIHEGPQNIAVFRPD
ncbi:MAG: 6-carboxytetrahydropterin synthase [Leptospirales bacterium]|nr:6-carboxytetrahydropterin synthase [Leptospirales bacterium]